MLKLIALTTLVLTFAAPIGRADSGEGNHFDRGQSDCSHRANVQDLKGEERRDFVEWCVARSDSFDDAQRNGYSDCNARANQRGLRDEERREFIDWCVGRDDRKRRLL